MNQQPDIEPKQTNFIQIQYISILSMSIPQEEIPKDMKTNNIKFAFCFIFQHKL